MKPTFLIRCLLFYAIFFSGLPKVFSAIVDSERAGESAGAPGGLDIWVDKPVGASVCTASIKFSSLGAGNWLFESVFGDLFPDAGRLKLFGTATDVLDGSSIPDGGLNNIKLDVNALSGDILNSSFKFKITKGGESAIYTITVKNNCSVATPTVTVTLTGGPSPACIGPGDVFPNYDLTITRTPTTPSAQTYSIALSPPTSGASPFAINGLATVTINANDASAIKTIALGGQAVGAAVSTTYTVTVTESVPAGTRTASTTVTIDINGGCQKNAMVVKVNPSGAPPAWTLADNPMNMMTDVQDWLKRASFGKAIFNPFQLTNEVTLSNPFSFYNNPNPPCPIVPCAIIPQIPITTLAQEVVTQILTANSSALNNVKHLLLFLNTTSSGTDVGPAGYWAVPEMTYQKPGGGTVTLGLSIHPRLNPSDASSWKQVAHGIGHQFDLNDLTIFDNTGTPLQSAVTPIDFDLMAIPASGIGVLKNVHPLAETKFERSSPSPAWIGSVGTPAVEFIDNNTGGVLSTTKTIVPADSWNAVSPKPVALVLGLDNTSSILTNEKVYVWIEARPNVSSKDEVGGTDKIVVYYANKNITAGDGQRIKWYDLEAGLGIQFSHGHEPLISPALKIGDSGWSIEGVDIVSGEYKIKVSYVQPSNAHDASIVRGSPGWLSPDIKTQIDGCGSCTGTEVAGDVDTKVIATVRNPSGTTAADVVVEFLIGRTSVAGVADLTRTTFGTVYTTIPSGGTVECFAFLNLQLLEGITWGPDLINALRADPSRSHYCLFVNVRPITPGDSDPSNNEAQRNVGFVENAHASPYPAIDYTFYVSNPDDIPRLALFNVKNVAKQWQFNLTPDRVSLGPKETKSVKMHIEVPQSFPSCTNFPLEISASIAVDHTLIPLGGITPFIELRDKTTLDASVKVITCKRDSIIDYSKRLKATAINQPGKNDQMTNGYNRLQYAKLLDNLLSVIVIGDAKKERSCATLIVDGCTKPPRPNEKMTIMYQDPAGNPIFKEVVTNGQGCFTDENIVVEGGQWKTTAIYPGNGCYSSAKEEIKTDVPIPITGDQDNDGRKDIDEIQGDEDGDGIPGQLDPDSDNDGIKDGDEPLGNYDCDSYANVIDPDSDNDGINDGKDQTPYGNTPPYRLFFNAFYHHFDFDTDLPIKDANGFNLRAGFNFNPKWAVEGEFGITNTKDVDDKSGNVYNLNLNAMYYLLNRPAVAPYLTAGLGALLFTGFPKEANTFAVNGGIGVIATQPNLIHGLALRAEVKGHYGFSAYDTNGNFNLQYTFGILYRFQTSSTPCNIDRRIKEARK